MVFYIFDRNDGENAFFVRGRNVLREFWCDFLIGNKISIFAFIVIFIRMSARKSKGEMGYVAKVGGKENEQEVEVGIGEKSPPAIRKSRSRSRTPRKTPVKDDKSLKYRARDKESGKNTKSKSPVKGSISKSPIKTSKTCEPSSKRKSPIKRTPKRSKTDK